MILLDMQTCGIGDHISALPAISMLDAEIYGNRFTGGMYSEGYILAAGQIESKAFCARYEAVIDFGSTASRYYTELGQTDLMDMFAERANVMLPEEFSWIDYWQLSERERGDYVVFCGTGSDSMRSMPDEFTFGIEHVTLTDKPDTPGFYAKNFRELAMLIYNAKAVVSIDSGPLHLACVLGTPVVGIYGPTGESIGRQYERYLDVNQIAVHGKTNHCTMPCYRNDKNGFSRCSSLRHGHCMSTVTPLQIEEAYAGL